MQKIDIVKKPLRMIVVSDLHYLSPAFTDNGTRFQRVMENGDGKLAEYSSEIIDALLETVQAEKPTALIFTGDLTFNGEKQSLQELAEKFSALEKFDIPVLVIPGNHDINYPYAYRYAGETATPVENITQAQFQNICHSFGYDRALSKDSNSFSYVYELSEDVRLLFLDANTETEPGSIKAETLLWARKQLNEAQKQSVTVISVTHQNVLPQNRLFSQNFVAENYKDVSALLREYGVTVNISGHSHIHHHTEENGLTDYATGAISVTPLRYGILEIDENRNITYTASHLTILQDEAKDRFILCNKKKMIEELSKLDISQDIAAEMLDFMLEFNLAYFSGTLESQVFLEKNGYALWKQYGKNSFWLQYINSVLLED